MRSPRDWKRSAMPRPSGSSGPTTVRSIRSRAAKSASAFGIAGDRRRHRRATSRDAGIAGGADDLADAALRRELPGERVLAAAAADHQHFHDAVIKCKLREVVDGGVRPDATVVRRLTADSALCLESAFTCDSLAYSVGFTGPTEDTTAALVSSFIGDGQPMFAHGGREGGVFQAWLKSKFRKANRSKARFAASSARCSRKISSRISRSTPSI